MPSRYDVKVTCEVCKASFPTVAESVGHEHFTDEYEQSQRDTRTEIVLRDAELS